MPVEAVKMQVVRVEKTRTLERQHVRDRQPAPFEDNQALSS
jgi:hypothetical protein